LSSDRDIDVRSIAAREAARRAGAVTWRYFLTRTPARHKADQTPVTDADTNAESILRESLLRQFPDDGFLGEEFGECAGASGFRWIVDPLDATKNFVRGIPLFATLVGLEASGQMAAGFVYVPVFDHLYHAVRGQGAYRNDQSIRVSAVERLDHAMLVYSSISWFDQTGTDREFLRLARSVARTRGFGDFYGYLLVAEGSADVMLEPAIAPWDIAALKPIVEEAGGRFTDWHGGDTIFGQGAVAANPRLHQLVMSCLHP
jgi:histidinol-phosphatase